MIHDAMFEGRSVMKRASLVEMAVPYADPNPPFERKCAFDVGDYGLGYCADSLELGCDCLGHIRYFDAVLCDSRGEPYVTKKAICMHEEDMGVLWKHVEYRNGHNEARRARRLVVSFVATVVNYEYLFYWYFNQDGSMEYEIKLSGMLSTNLLSAGERVDGEGAPTTARLSTASSSPRGLTPRCTSTCSAPVWTFRWTESITWSTRWTFSPGASVRRRASAIPLQTRLGR